jgi:hypothetical protein
MANNVVVSIVAGLGYVWSDGIVYKLRDDLKRHAGVIVRVAAHSDFEYEIEFCRMQPAGTVFVGVGHSLGGAVWPRMAREIGKPVAAIFGFDAADNIGANVSPYRLTAVPPNVEVAYSVFVPGGALGGGGYWPEDKSTTHCENHPMPDASHTEIEEAVNKHLLIEDFVLRHVQG